MALLTNAYRNDDVEADWYQIHCTVSRVAMLSLFTDVQETLNRLDSSPRARVLKERTRTFRRRGNIFTLFNSQSKFGPFEIRLKAKAAHLQAVLDEDSEESYRMQLIEESAERKEALRRQFSDVDDLGLLVDNDTIVEGMLCLRPEMQTPSPGVTTMRNVVVRVPALKDSEFAEDTAKDPCQGKALGEECQTFSSNIPDKIIAEEAGHVSEIQKWKLKHTGRCHLLVVPHRKGMLSDVVDPETPLSYASARRFYYPTLWTGLLSKLLQPIMGHRYERFSDGLYGHFFRPTFLQFFQFDTSFPFRREEPIHSEKAKWNRPTAKSVTEFVAEIPEKYWSALRHSAKFIVEEHVLPFLYSLQTTQNLQEAVQDYCHGLRAEILFRNGAESNQTNMEGLFEDQYSPGGGGVSSSQKETAGRSEELSRRYIDNTLLSETKLLLNGDRGEKPALVFLIRLCFRAESGCSQENI